MVSGPAKEPGTSAASYTSCMHTYGAASQHSSAAPQACHRCSRLLEHASLLCWPHLCNGRGLDSFCCPLGGRLAVRRQGRPPCLQHTGMRLMLVSVGGPSTCCCATGCVFAWSGEGRTPVCNMRQQTHAPLSAGAAGAGGRGKLPCAMPLAPAACCPLAQQSIAAVAAVEAGSGPYARAVVHPHQCGLCGTVFELCDPGSAGKRLKENTCKQTSPAGATCMGEAGCVV
jgi:hypothetical protein